MNFDEIIKLIDDYSSLDESERPEIIKKLREGKLINDLRDLIIFLANKLADIFPDVIQPKEIRTSKLVSGLLSMLALHAPAGLLIFADYLLDFNVFAVKLRDKDSLLIVIEKSKEFKANPLIMELLLIRICNYANKLPKSSKDGEDSASLESKKELEAVINYLKQIKSSILVLESKRVSKVFLQYLSLILNYTKSLLFRHLAPITGALPDSNIFLSRAAKDCEIIEGSSEAERKVAECYALGADLFSKLPIQDPIQLREYLISESSSSSSSLSLALASASSISPPRP